MTDTDKYIEAYSEKKFWHKLTRFGKTAGVAVVEKALLLFYATQEESVPLWAKTTMLGALGYFLSPIDAIPDLTPMLGYSDDLGVLVLAIATVSTYVNDNVRLKAKDKIAEWF